MHIQARRKEKKSWGASNLSKNLDHHGWPTKKMFQLKSSKTAVGT